MSGSDYRENLLKAQRDPTSPPLTSIAFTGLFSLHCELLGVIKRKHDTVRGAIPSAIYYIFLTYFYSQRVALSV